jgi:hypothetical protein
MDPKTQTVAEGSIIIIQDDPSFAKNNFKPLSMDKNEDEESKSEKESIIQDNPKPDSMDQNKDEDFYVSNPLKLWV